MIATTVTGTRRAHETRTTTDTANKARRLGKARMDGTITASTIKIMTVATTAAAAPALAHVAGARTNVATTTMMISMPDALHVLTKHTSHRMHSSRWHQDTMLTAGRRPRALQVACQWPTDNQLHTVNHNHYLDNRACPLTHQWHLRLVCTIRREQCSPRQA